MDIKLRIGQPSDYNETENVTREAFWNHFSPGCDEHYLLHIMRNHPKFVPELDIVAELNGKIVGNVVCLKSFIMADDGNQYEVLSLAHFCSSRISTERYWKKNDCANQRASFRYGISCHFTLR